ncbi:S8 family peptidase [Bacillus mobilis]|uniref:S8 family peptidase n=1 Tax=Bacillus mobilis TaxID=2026190 RepID=UPI002E1B3DF8|nr:S8 family peptidase [Bacillus mobilis]
MEKNKNLPIKIFEKRVNVDERSTEGGGTKKPPSFVLAGGELKKKADILLEDLNVAVENIEKKMTKSNGLPAVIKAKVIEDAIAKSHRKDLNKLLTADKENSRFIGMSNNQELLIRVDDLKQLAEIDNNIKDFRRNDKAISGIDAIGSFEPEVDKDEVEENRKGKYIFKIRLFDFNNFQLNTAALNQFKNLIEQVDNIEFVKTVKYADNLYIQEIVADSIEAIKIFDDFSPIMSIEPMPIIEVIEDDFFIERDFKAPSPKDGINYPIIGVLDSGIADNSTLNPWKFGKRHTNYPPNYLNPSHGTFVSGIITFGDVFAGKDYTGVNGFRLLDAAVFPDAQKESITEGELIDNIREVVEKYSDEVKIWNLSLGTKVEVKNSDFSTLGIALDSIQDENDILIIKSAGNCNNFFYGKPTSRIARGADSVRALTVGSIAHSKKQFDIANYNNPSPFSRTGPGPVNIVKPELVHYGGNVGINAGKAVMNGVQSLNTNGQVASNIGTSFSTPRVTAIAADLNEKLSESFDPVLLKALLLHSAKYPNEVELSINEKINQLGFGMPSKANEILYNNPHEITLILRDTLNKGEFIEILDFSFPQSLVENGYYYGQILVTLVNTPVLAENQGPEYCQSDIQVLLGTYNQKVNRDTNAPTIKNPIGRDPGGKNLLTTNIYSKKKSRDIQGFARSEKMLVRYGEKFYPNKKYAVDLKDVTQANKEKFLCHPKNWYLKIEGLYREFVETQAEQNRMGLSQEFCVIITIRDPYKKQPVYNEVSKSLFNNNFIHRNIKVNQEIDISVD